jgi:8-oxo-dGTP pyrophosphatase MutT (NUDIX family)
MGKIIIYCAALFVEHGRVLLVQHGDDKFWKFCGGKIENLDVGLLELARKEAKEELGIDFRLRENEPFAKYLPLGDADSRIDTLSVNFWAQREGEIVKADKIRDSRWVPLDKMYEIRKAPNIIPALEHFGFKVDEGFSQNVE